VRTLEDPVQNIRVGAAYLGFLKERFGGESVWWMSAYNLGPVAVWKLAQENRQPVQYRGRVLTRYNRLYTELARAKREQARHPARWLAAQTRHPTEVSCATF
jgi:soluble lytic murein transglycosylase